MRILVVDDESLNRFLLIHMLEENGYRDCFEAETGEEAIEVAERITPDLVLLDVMMPGISGYEVAPELKKQQAGIYLPIIFITALDDEESLVKCLTVGGDDFVAKPFNKVILAAKLKAHARTRLLSKKANQQNEQLLYHQRNVEREHSIVEHIFSNVLTLNKRLTKFIDYQLAPASNFNGDMLLIERSPNGGLYILLGDFTGHGLASAIGAIPVSRAFQTMTEKGVPVSEMVETINKILLDFLPDGMFFAAAIIEVADSGKQIDIWNGGLPHLILLGTDGKVKHRFDSMHMALGILDDEDFENDVIRYDLEYGERIFGYTDGVIELADESGEMLLETGLETWVESCDVLNTEQLMKNIAAYQKQGEEQADDITMFIFESRNINLPKKLAQFPSLPFEIELTLNQSQFANTNPVSELIDMLSGHAAFHGIRSNIFTVLSELYNNSLDHGVLELPSSLKQDPEGFMEYFQQREERLETIESGNIDIVLSYKAEPCVIEFEIKDSGSGFDFNDIYSKADSDNAFGRGLALVKELADELVYSEHGTRVKASFLLQQKTS